MPYSFAFMIVYPLGIPLFLLFCLWFAGIPELVKTKLDQARFFALLNFRNRQLNSMTRSLFVFAVGHSMDDDEFKRRVQHVYDSGESAWRLQRLVLPACLPACFYLSSKFSILRALVVALCSHSASHQLPGLHTLFVTDENSGEKVMTHSKLRLAIAALGDVHPTAVPHGDVHDLLEKYDNNFNGLDMDEFTVGFLRDLSFDSRQADIRVWGKGRK